MALKLAFEQIGRLPVPADFSLDQAQCVQRNKTGALVAVPLNWGIDLSLPMEIGIKGATMEEIELEAGFVKLHQSTNGSAVWDAVLVNPKHVDFSQADVWSKRQGYTVALDFRVSAGLRPVGLSVVEPVTLIEQKMGRKFQTLNIERS